MANDKFREMLTRSFTGDLTPDEAAELSAHLKTNPDLQAEVAELKKLFAALGNPNRYEPSPELLQQARAELRVVLRSVTQPVSVWQKILSGVKTFVSIAEWQPQVRLAAGGFAVLAIGVVLGYGTFRLASPQLQSQGQSQVQLVSGSATGSDPLKQSDISINNVRILNTDAENGEIEFSFDAVKNVHIKGNASDERVQKLLTHAILNEQNAGVRLQAVSAIKNEAKLPDADIKKALIKALKSDENPGVRREALTVLQKFPMDADIKQAFLYALQNDKNSGLRISVINSLTMNLSNDAKPDKDVLGVLETKVQSDDNNYVRLRAKSILEGAK
jgi:hypothetical protein